LISRRVTARAAICAILVGTSSALVVTNARAQDAILNAEEAEPTQAWGWFGYF